MKLYPTVLSIAGSDSGSGAGIQADIKAVSACKAYAATAITAITAQNTVGVSNVYPMPGHVLAEQMEAVLSDIEIDAVKIGMLHSLESIKAVCKTLERYHIKNVVLDPVMVATSGDRLLQDEALSLLKKQLIPNVRIITPNIPEAEILLDRKIESCTQLAAIAKDLANMYQVSVLLKAGHLPGNELTDVFYDMEKNEILNMKSVRIQTKNTHGTGCTLSSSLAAFLARGFDMQTAVQMAKSYINQAIDTGKDFKIGKGHGPVHHFYQYWDL